MDVAVMSTIVPMGNYYALKRENVLKKYDKVVAAKDIVDILHHRLDARYVVQEEGFCTLTCLVPGRSIKSAAYIKSYFSSIISVDLIASLEALLLGLIVRH